MNDFTAIEQLATQGKKIQAIKEFRTVTRVGLKDAKDAVEWFQSHGEWPAQYREHEPEHEPASDDRFAQAEHFVAQGKKINAIKEFRTAVPGVGLKDAKDAVEWFQRQGQWPDQYRQQPPPEHEPTQGSSLAAAEQFMQQGKKIHAIKELRTLTGWGLKESKAAVDEYQARGRWPKGMEEAVGGRPAEDTPPASDPSGGRRAEIEQYVTDGLKIMAIKILRKCTGFGLRESKAAVEHYQASGAWAPAVLEALGEPPAPAPTPSAPSPAPTHAPASATTTASDPELAAALAVLQQHLGRAPDVRLAVRAQRVPYEGYLVMLGDRACFVRKDRGQWMLDPIVPVFWYQQITAVELDYSLGTDIHISMGHIHEWFSGLDPSDAEAAQALFSVVAP